MFENDYIIWSATVQDINKYIYKILNRGFDFSQLVYKLV